ncbi:peptidoglycan/xylan/chitin deacetylase (PgdA/CDA1 family) [Leeuwenhoekiella aestuarii]|uniref:Peptidoglycan/xylan/chitin deacetylase (PgdA/CDA1 family) n=1 Tax=Leeuwenhoekiella aestuarii TaxID=2249426 RepID=A0A4V1KP79_9FLAO|nr:polysaccharide deacetylase family protein [Leeuwenhoekiella aestuarii]RXG14137.1 peptidoglycan/xylan/chitin deacetylase (PgdA/CDA1 family) [Leeuwenhoekiella aestuarii]RXG18886.1 peptidoglycan/xylan/chitin deacetylase (PgdA/CDA1 family) [Leeuwenhoekiella aestuarii]
MPLKINLPVKTPKLLKRLYSGYVWDKIKDCQSQKKLYLTFDDGPIPEVTPWVLDTLRQYRAQATFFCIGENITKHPHIFQKLIDSEHSIGNHTYNHLKGWEYGKTIYVENMVKAEAEIEIHTKTQKLFRPPYGKIRRNQAKAIQKRGYEIIMYDVIAYDWEQGISGESCAANIIKNAESGSIIVFHDSFKAEKNMKYALPKVLDHFSKLGYTFEKL